MVYFPSTSILPLSANALALSRLTETLGCPPLDTSLQALSTMTLRTEEGTKYFFAKRRFDMDPGTSLLLRSLTFSIVYQDLTSDRRSLHRSFTTFSSILARTFSLPQVNSSRLSVLGLTDVASTLFARAIKSSWCMSWAS